MDNYTVTFYCRDCINVPQEENVRQDKVCGEVLDKLLQHKLELVDFNLTENYDTYPDSHKKSSTLRTIIEIKLDLTRADLASREAIYNKCLYAMLQNKLYLSKDAQAGHNGQERQLLVFDMKHQAA
ncbi:hypothetical protein AM493_10665 [Flavobacterium akiainvivens]|uniref:Uncharacterized protein n=1 Tax=Flavobacterium akiainvivens TaxID=1202724 RepID=A0A0M8MB74_9FLAO|nr:hypothetical protein [Flavobacterium akiainvivens]KOS06445.1 hypothetical protein AM493_10665 [Flavobacterium akiainvivens]SFQ13383.1 hypothetical protein SAMN05444144_101229 [Flavobacterium akiainvivens]